MGSVFKRRKISPFGRNDNQSEFPQAVMPKATAGNTAMIMTCLRFVLGAHTWIYVARAMFVRWRVMLVLPLARFSSIDLIA
jgi:hypothetical protein